MEKGDAPAYKSDHVGISFEGTDHALAWKKFQDENIDKSKLFFELPTTTDAHGNVIEHPEETCGLEDHPHITLLYGLSGHKDQVAETAMASDYLNGKFGPINKFSNKDRGYDVIWISLKDHNLTPFVDSLQENTGVKSKFPTYTPHMTLAYVLPESHDHLLGQEPLEGMEFTCDRVSYKDNAETGGKISIPLNKVAVENRSESLIAACSEALDVIPHGILGSTLFVTINGRKYGYNAAPNAGKSIEEIEKTFIDMIKHGAGKALAWLKKVTVLASGSVKGLSKLDPSRHNQSLGGLK
jgi:2'-5' RNA ligase